MTESCKILLPKVVPWLNTHDIMSSMLLTLDCSTKHFRMNLKQKRPRDPSPTLKKNLHISLDFLWILLHFSFPRHQGNTFFKYSMWAKIVISFTVGVYSMENHFFFFERSIIRTCKIVGELVENKVLRKINKYYLF